ncbi:O-antigen ligase family protein [Pseudoalteromonas fuliginea]|uniref:O-antigen ligase family protein n=1 Tax=Pseudoalteromonas fuliginea TaxID=1872678 RepID=UPI00316D5FC7
MKLSLIVFFSLLCVVNLPIATFLTSKRLGFLGLLFLAITKFFSCEKPILKREGMEVILFWGLYLFSSVIGIFISTEINSTALAIGLTCLNIFILKFLLDNEEATNIASFQTGWLLATYFLTFLFLYQIAFVLNFDILKVFYLRKYLLESSFSINSTFNQIVFLIFLQVFVICSHGYSRFKRYFSFILALALFGITIMSFSRQNLLACLVMFGYIIYHFTNNKQKTLIALVFLPVFVFFVSSSLNDDEISGVHERVDKTVSQVADADYTRFRQYVDSIQAGLDSPFLGVGLGNYYDYAKKLGYHESVRVPEAALNQVMAEHGAILFVLFMMILFYLYSKFHYSSFGMRDFILFRGIFLAFFVLLFFNEIHAQASIWLVFLLFVFLKSLRKV